MSKFHDAAQVLKREAIRFAALNQAAEALEELGSIDQAATEAKARAEAFTKEADVVKAEVDALKASAAKLKEAQASKQKEADAAHAQLMVDANVRHDQLVAEATAKAQSIVSNAEDTANARIASAEKQLATMQKIKEALSAQCDELHEKQKAATTEAEIAESRLSKVKEAIAKLHTA
ncbi:MAG: hypothetical protein WC208_13525 [Gallionella sp.]|jgi:chromosome segregation ATPase